ncbi:MAG: N-acetylmuramoyl-L-alanine amidase family protein [Huintestinicola sp.]|uniref:N-acetylmuramoyl-L-alanine amidase family protein n=1 Tax=Huintestinicola sp. TaxID=2981661 RepID=UPI003F08149A
MIKRRIASVFLAAVLAASAIPTMSATASAAWVKSESGYSYKDDETGKKLTGWQTIDGNKYYFDKNGYAVTGWKKIGDNKYYFNASKKGKMITGWSKIGGSRYYFGKDGKMRTGFVKLSGKTYYFGKDGKMRTGKLKINGKVYDFGNDGVLKSGASADSSSKLMAPLDGLKWGMSRSDVIKKGNFNKYVNADSVLVVQDSDPYKYYIFDKNDKLVCVGYVSYEGTKYLDTFKSYFKKAGWKFERSTKDGAEYTYEYSKDDSLGGIFCNDEMVMTMVFSDDVTSQLESGVDLSDIVDLG